MIKKQASMDERLFPLVKPRAIDGDTVESIVCLPFGQTATLRLRLKGWWAHETTGRYACEGVCAKNALQSFLDRETVWAYSPNYRQDRYGRWLVHLWAWEKIVEPKMILGGYQLTEEEHRRARDEERREKAQRRIIGGSGVPSCI